MNVGCIAASCLHVGTAVETQQVQKYDQGYKSWCLTPGHLRILKTKVMALEDGGFCRCHLSRSSGCQAPWYAVKLIFFKGYNSIAKDCMARCPAGFNCNRTPVLSYCIMYYACLVHPASLLLNVHKYNIRHSFGTSVFVFAWICFSLTCSIHMLLCSTCGPCHFGLIASAIGPVLRIVGSWHDCLEVKLLLISRSLTLVCLLWCTRVCT